MECLKTRLSMLPGAVFIKRALYGALAWEPFPEYRDPRSKEWQLMAALIQRLKGLAGPRPLVVLPTFYSSYVRFRMARNYWDRYASLGVTPGVYVIDLLPHLQRLKANAVKCFQEPYDMHFSGYGHLVLADALAEALTTLNL